MDGTYHCLLSFLFGVLLVLSATVVVGHGNDGEDDVDQVEGAEEDDDDEEEDVVWTVGANHLPTVKKVLVPSDELNKIDR